MTAFLFTLTLFLYWAVVGLAVISIFPPRLRILQGILISPAVGIATVILPVFLLSRAGLPVKDFADWLLPALGALSLIALFIRKPILPWKRLGWFGLILIGALLLIGWPMFVYGFDWLSFANDDMANYSLGAQRFLNHGYFDLPNVENLLAGRDYSEAYWFMHVAGKARTGSELMLAAVWASTGLNAHEIFMPVIEALHLSLICSGAALAVGSTRSAKAPLITAVLIAVSPLTALGTLYQLIGQVGGLSILCTSVLLFYRKTSIRPVVRLVKANVVGAVSFAALFVWYPEVLPFLGLGWFVFLALKLSQEGKPALRIFMPALVIGALAFAMLGEFVLSAFQFMLSQATGGTFSNPANVLFPYFMVPSGMPVVVGLIPLAKAVHEPILSISIAIAMALIFWFTRLLISCVKKLYPGALILVVMVFVWLMLFFTNNAFGVFKLSMYVQPFVLATIGSALAGFVINLNKIKIFIATAISVINVAAQQDHVKSSVGELYGGFQSIPGVSAQHVNRDFSTLLTSMVPSSKLLVSDVENIVLAKFQSLYFYGKGGIFLSRDFFGYLADMGGVNELSEKYHLGFNKKRIQSNGAGNEFDVKSELAANDFRLIETSRHNSIFNFFEPAGQSAYFRLVDNPINHLVFIHSELGSHYYLPRNEVAYYGLERDVMAQGHFVSGLGRHQLFMVVGATEKPRMVIALTTTVIKQFDRSLPQPSIQGESSVGLTFVGRGSGRIISAPLVPQRIDNLQYIGLDMGREGRQFPNKLTGLMFLYGREIPQDYRHLAAFGREISLISEAEYQALNAPHGLSDFPMDLLDRNLEYSGIYEDGWISERSFFVLTPKQDSRFLAVKGMVPQIDSPDFRTTLTVSIDGREVIKHSLGFGNFEIKVPVLTNDPRRRIDLAFDRYQVLPGEDGRPTGGKIEFIGFTKD